MITLTRTNKNTKKEKEEYLRDFNSLDRKLSTISTSHYNINDYHIKSNDFNGLVKDFQDNFYPNFYEINFKEKTIQIFKMKVGKKRHIYIDTPQLTPENRLKRKITKSSKYLKGSKYDNVSNNISVMFEGKNYTFHINANLEIDDIYIDGQSVKDLKRAIRISTDLKRKINNY